MDGGVKILLPDLEAHPGVKLARDQMLAWAREMAAKHLKDFHLKNVNEKKQMIYELQQAASHWH